jgi:predicted DNA-binding protein
VLTYTKTGGLMDKVRNSRIGIRLSEIQHQRLKVVAAATNRTQGNVIEELIDKEYQRYLESVELSKPEGRNTQVRS